ncbi:MAG: hypothetical protein ACJ77B_11405 [Chloroflexota bacterium]
MSDRSASTPQTTGIAGTGTTGVVDESPPERRRNPRLRAVVDGIVRVADAAHEPDEPKRRRRATRAIADPRPELREQLRRLEQIRPRGTALTAVSRRDSLGWHAVLNGPGYGATGIGDTPPAAIAHLVHLLGGGE